jgi:lysophospholipase L1-like esterase
MTLFLLPLLLILLLLTFTAVIMRLFVRRLLTNENPTYWEKRVQGIEKRYAGDYPHGCILFAGSSSIAYWSSLEHDMMPLQVLNHGIAGTKIADVTFYTHRLIVPFSPRGVVLYAGTNDINGIKGNSKTGEEVYRLTIQFFTAIHEKLPHIPVFYISISPSKARWEIWKEATAANRLIQEYCNANPNLKFIDTTPFLLNAAGNPMGGIFRPDGLHFNKKGYKIWAEVIQPFLVKN